MAPGASRMYRSPVDILQRLIRFDTTNPPGNEAECMGWIDDLLTESGIDTRILFEKPDRPNLIARLRGRGAAPPLLLYGHVDVVTTANQKWTHPPFAGALADGYIWGRGALDMKGGVAMMLAAFMRAEAEGLTPAGDIVLAVLSDEEAGGELGADFLVAKHASEFEGIRYAIGEFGGFALRVSGRKFYPIQIAEKQICWMKATIRGPGGHGSQPMRDGAMAKLGRMLRQLDQNRLPVRITPVARRMIETMCSALPFPSGRLIRLLLNPRFTDMALQLMGARGRIFDAMLHNTVNATIVRGGEKVNVIPSEIVVEMDGRLVPGCSPEDMMAELRGIMGDQVEFEVIRHEPVPGEPDMGLFDTLADILREADPGAVPVPLLLSGATDARFFSRLGIRSYGFLPMNLPADFNFTRTIHAEDERIPVESLHFGTEAIYRLLQRYNG